MVAQTFTIYSKRGLEDSDITRALLEANRKVCVKERGEHGGIGMSTERQNIKKVYSQK